MNTPNDGGPAFPATYWDHNLEGITAREQFFGMTLRDYFAAKAIPKALSMAEDYYDPTEKDGQFYECAAEICGKLADAMLAERNKTT